MGSMTSFEVDTVRVHRPRHGTCGSGKTTLGMEFLVRGALAGEACAHFTATEPSVKLLENIRQYSFFDVSLVDTGLINVFDMDVLYHWLGLDKTSFDLDDVHALIKAITDIVNTIGVTRLVIDSVTTLCYKIKSEQLIRDFLFTLGKKLATLGCTTILISEITSSMENAHWSSFGVEEAIADGIMVMGDVERMGHLLRFLQVVKMRGDAPQPCEACSGIDPTRRHAHPDVEVGVAERYEHENEGLR